MFIDIVSPSPKGNQQFFTLWHKYHGQQLWDFSLITVPVYEFDWTTIFLSVLLLGSLLTYLLTLNIQVIHVMCVDSRVRRSGIKWVFDKSDITGTKLTSVFNLSSYRIHPQFNAYNLLYVAYFLYYDWRSLDYNSVYLRFLPNIRVISKDLDWGKNGLKFGILLNTRTLRITFLIYSNMCLLVDGGIVLTRVSCPTHWIPMGHRNYY